MKKIKRTKQARPKHTTAPAETKGQALLRVRLAGREANDRYSEYPSEGLTPRRLATIFKEADEGNVYRQMELMEEMEEKDPHLFSQLQTRKLAVTGLAWEVQPASDEDQDKEIAEFIVRQLEDLEDFDGILIDMLDAIGKGISVMELIWNRSAQGYYEIESVEYVHPKKLVWDSNQEALKICTTDCPQGIPIIRNKFAVHHYKARSGHEARAGILRVVAWMYLFKNYDVKDWVAFCEVFGMPLRLGKYDAAASERDKKQLEEAIFSLGTDAAGIVPSTTMIEFIESQKSTSIDLYERLARYCDEQISKAVLGQTLTSDSGGGSYAQSKTHNEVRHDLTIADAKALAVTIRRDIIKPLVELNYGSDVSIPFFSFDSEDTKDQKEQAEIYRTLVCEMGLEIPKSHIYKIFNIPKPEDGEDVLSPPASNPTPPDIANEDHQKTLKLKSSKTEELPGQGQVDRMTDQAVRTAQEAFADLIRPLIQAVDNSKGMEELQALAENQKTLKAIYEAMDGQALEDLLHQGMYLAHLAGRMEHG